MTMSVHLIKIPVSDVARSAPFYRDVLGLNEQFVVAEYGWAQFSTDNLDVALYEPNKGGGIAVAGASDHVHFFAEDEDAFKARLSSAGLDPDGHLQTGDDGTTFYNLQDPDGNRFKVFV